MITQVGNNEAHARDGPFLYFLVQVGRFETNEDALIHGHRVRREIEVAGTLQRPHNSNLSTTDSKGWRQTQGLYALSTHHLLKNEQRFRSDLIERI